MGRVTINGVNGDFGVYLGISGLGGYRYTFYLYTFGILLCIIWETYGSYVLWVVTFGVVLLSIMGYLVVLRVIWLLVMSKVLGWGFVMYQ